MWHRQRRKADEDDTNDRRFGVCHVNQPPASRGAGSPACQSEGKGLNA